MEKIYKYGSKISDLEKNHKKYCWEVYKNSECESCKYFSEFKQNPNNLIKFKEIILVDDAN